MKIYTKTGDSGETGLFGGPRVSKDSLRIEAYGTIDELNAILGLVRSEAPPAELDGILTRLQNQLFDLGAELATPNPDKHGTRTIGQSQITWQEQEIDRLQESIEQLKQFVLPGGTRAAAWLHLARCVCRRAERRLVTLTKTEPISPDVVTYVNRLSDFLFVMARYANHLAGVADVPWVKGC